MMEKYPLNYVKVETILNRIFDFGLIGSPCHSLTMKRRFVDCLLFLRDFSCEQRNYGVSREEASELIDYFLEGDPKTLPQDNEDVRECNYCEQLIMEPGYPVPFFSLPELSRDNIFSTT